MKKFFEEFKEFASSFLSDVVNFIFMAFVLFCLLKAINKLTSIGHKVEEPKAPTTKNAPSVKQRSTLRQHAVQVLQPYRCKNFFCDWKSEDRR